MPSLLNDGTILASPKEQYTIIKRLGGGGFGEVYCVENPQGEILAAKIRKTEQEVNAEGGDFDVCKKTFEKEYGFLEELKQSKGVPRVEEIFNYQDTRVIIMELIEGDNLRNIATQQVEIKYAVSWMIDLLKTLEEVHKKDITWRDAKSENIMLTDKGEIKILDFGTSTRLKPGQTRRTTAVGFTWAFVSPDVVKGGGSKGTPSERRDDIYSVGAVLQELVSGQEPGVLSNPDHEIKKGMLPPPLDDVETPKMEPGCLIQLNSDVPQALEEIIFRAKRWKREDRYQTAAAMRKDLEDLDKIKARAQKAQAKQQKLQSHQPTVLRKVQVAFSSQLDKCPLCNAEIYLKDKFCHTCGVRIKK